MIWLLAKQLSLISENMNRMIKLNSGEKSEEGGEEYDFEGVSKSMELINILMGFTNHYDEIED